jgi:hypothetical protein
MAQAGYALVVPGLSLHPQKKIFEKVVKPRV